MSREGGGPSRGGDGGAMGKTPQQIAAQKRLQQTQAQVDEVIGIMRLNVDKVLERDQKLSELDDRSHALQQGASQFEQQAGKLKRKYWYQNMKMMVILGIVILIIIIIIGILWPWWWKEPLELELGKSVANSTKKHHESVEKHSTVTRATTTRTTRLTTTTTVKPTSKATKSTIHSTSTSTVVTKPTTRAPTYVAGGKTVLHPPKKISSTFENVDFLLAL